MHYYYYDIYQDYPVDGSSILVACLLYIILILQREFIYGVLVNGKFETLPVLDQDGASVMALQKV